MFVRSEAGTGGRADDKTVKKEKLTFVSTRAKEKSGALRFSPLRAGASVSTTGDDPSYGATCRFSEYFAGGNKTFRAASSGS